MLNHSGFFKLQFLFTIFLQLYFIYSPVNADSIISVIDYFPGVSDDLTKVTWAHAVNNRAKLNASLNDNTIMMIEADVLMGHLEGSPAGGNPIPIMGHPPATTSDLSLEEFLNTILKSQKSKGVKLDFKSKEVFAGSENILEEILVKPDADFPVWMNADILPGPVASTVVPVDADYFVSTVVKKFPSAMLSVGWTTRLGGDVTTGQYTAEDVSNMTEALNRNFATGPVTFPVRAALAANSRDVLTTLVRSSVHGTTLTIWNSNDADKVDVGALRQLINELGRDKIYLDLPARLMEQINANAASSPFRIGAGYLILFGITVLSMLAL